MSLFGSTPLQREVAALRAEAVVLRAENAQLRGHYAEAQRAYADQCERYTKLVDRITRGSLLNLGEPSEAQYIPAPRLRLGDSVNGKPKTPPAEQPPDEAPDELPEKVIRVIHRRAVGDPALEQQLLQFAHSQIASGANPALVAEQIWFGAMADQDSGEGNYDEAEA